MEYRTRRFCLFLFARNRECRGLQERMGWIEPGIGVGVEKFIFSSDAISSAGKFSVEKSFIGIFSFKYRLCCSSLENYCFEMTKSIVPRVQCIIALTGKLFCQTNDCFFLGKSFLRSAPVNVKTFWAIHSVVLATHLMKSFKT